MRAFSFIKLNKFFADLRITAFETHGALKVCEAVIFYRQTKLNGKEENFKSLA